MCRLVLGCVVHVVVCHGQSVVWVAAASQAGVVECCTPVQATSIELCCACNDVAWAERYVGGAASRAGVVERCTPVQATFIEWAVHVV